MAVERRTKWLLGASLIVSAGLLGPAVTVWRSTPRPIRLITLSIAQARLIAGDHVLGGQMLMAAPTVSHHHPGYLFSFRERNGSILTLWVDGQSGRVVKVLGPPRTTVRSSSPSQGSKHTGGAKSPSALSSSAVSAIAARAVGGGQVIWIQRSETTDHGTWYYTAKVLLRNSSQAKVKISEFGQVLWVQTSSGN